MVASPVLGIVLIGIGLSSGLYLLIQTHWISFFERRLIQHCGYGVIVIICLVIAYASIGNPPEEKPRIQNIGGNVLSVGEANNLTVYQTVGNPNQPTNADLMDAIQAVDMKLEESARHVEKSYEKELEDRYPLGYIVVAFSGRSSAFLPRLDRFEVNPNDISLAINSDRTQLQIRVPKIHDRQFGNIIRDCYLYLPLVVGARSMDIPTGDAHVQAECLKADPIGTYVVLGFTDEQRPHTLKP